MSIVLSPCYHNIKKTSPWITQILRKRTFRNLQSHLSEAKLQAMHSISSDAQLSTSRVLSSNSTICHSSQHQSLTWRQSRRAYSQLCDTHPSQQLPHRAHHHYHTMSTQIAVVTSKTSSKLQTLPIPEPGPNEILVKKRCCGKQPEGLVRLK